MQYRITVQNGRAVETSIIDGFEALSAAIDAAMADPGFIRYEVARSEPQATSIQPHPWASTPEAFEAARKAIEIPKHLMPARAAMAGDDELFAEALVILAECALPKRRGGHVGSMWEWPESEMSKWAIREVGYALNHYLRMRALAATAA